MREIRRRDRLDSRLTALLTTARSQHVAIAPIDRSLELVNTRFSKLPAGIELTPRQLLIEFRNTADFLGKIGAVVFALQNDYESVSESIESTHG